MGKGLRSKRSHSGHLVFSYREGITRAESMTLTRDPVVHVANVNVMHMNMF